MRAVRSHDTKPELLVRKLAFEIRPGYRLHRKDIPGKPDLAYIGAKKVIFVHGCFWHGHDCARGARVPVQNRDYWVAKIGRNVERDERNLAAVAADGWHSLVIWECELKEPDKVRSRLVAFLSRFYP